MDEGWVGVDAGKGFHWAVVLDAEGEVLLSRKVENDEAGILALVEEARSFGLPELTWATDQPGGTAALLLALLWEQGERVFYVPGMAVDRARDAHRGESKTDDARDARLIAEQARMRRDLSELEPGEEALAELGLLVTHRRDLVVARTRAVPGSGRPFSPSSLASNAPWTSTGRARSCWSTATRPPKPFVARGVGA